MALDAVAEAPGTATAVLRVLVSELAQAARDAMATPVAWQMEAERSSRRRVHATSTVWRYARKIATLLILAELRPEQDSALSKLKLDDSQLAIAAALAALGDAAADSHTTLSTEQESAVHRLLTLPLPERQPPASAERGPGRPTRIGSRSKLLPGHVQAAEQAILSCRRSAGRPRIRGP